MSGSFEDVLTPGALADWQGQRKGDENGVVNKVLCGRKVCMSYDLIIIIIGGMR